MKKAIIFVVLALLLVGSVEAGEKHKISFVDRSRYILKMQERDILVMDVPVREYNLDDIRDEKENVKYVEKITKQAVMLRDSVKGEGVRVTTFIEGSETPYYNSITGDVVLKLDFNRDAVIDMEVGIANTNDSWATLIFNKLPQDKQPDFDYYLSFQKEDKNIFEKGLNFVKGNFVFWILVLIVLVLIASNKRKIRLHYRKTKRRLRR